MPISNVSFLGSSQAQIARLKNLNATLVDLQRQIASRKKNETLAGFGLDANAVLRDRTSKNRVDSYLANIDTVSTRINAMNAAMQSARDAVLQVIDGITTAVRDSSADVDALAGLAKNALNFIHDLANTQIDGRYLFAGTNTTSPPSVDKSTMNANFQTEINDWLNGTITTAQLQANVAAFTTTDLGLDPSLSTAGSVTIRIDDATELDYTVLADQGGFQEMIRALGLMANMQAPGPGDTPTDGDVGDILQTVLKTARAGIAQLDSSATNLGLNFNLIKEVQATHERDSAVYEGLIGDAEDADTTEVVTQIQLLQTQLQASYEVTNIVNQLSLINFL